MYSTQPVFVSVGHLCILHGLFLVYVGHLCILHSLFLVSVGHLCTLHSLFLVCVSHLCILHSLFLLYVGTPMYSTQSVFGVCRTIFVFYTACFWCM